MKVVAGPASLRLAKGVAEAMAAPLLPAVVTAFPDGEFKVRVPESVAGEEVALIASTYPPLRVLELFFLLDALREGGTMRITAIIPYFGFFRQDKAFEAGEGISARAIARRVEVDADAVVLVGIHNERILGYFRKPLGLATGTEALAATLRDAGTDMVLAPDAGASRLARELAATIGCPWDYLEKTRLDSWTVRTKAKSLDVSGRRVAIVDDVISTGVTMANAARVLREQGARAVVAACIHGIFVPGALERLAACDDVIATDTLENPRARVSVAGEVARALGALGVAQGRRRSEKGREGNPLGTPPPG